MGIDLDEMERRARAAEAEYDKQAAIIGAAYAQRGWIRPSSVLALVARVRELQGMYEHIVSTAESIGNARVAAERKRCVAIVESLSEKLHDCSARYLVGRICEEIERGDA
ncbi:MAG: hypothetical protein IPK75_18820 [Acidobacteria bacterium]|nr:hypothetical protein [Acidobacteriota bacterium]